MRHFIPLLFFLLLTPFYPYIDHACTEYFYDGGFPYPSRLLFKWGYYPALITPVIACFTLSKRSVVILFLSLVLGAGLIVNVLLKDRWGRPRPRHVTTYGGHAEYHPYYSPTFDSRYRSFPSGHAASGFYFFALAIVGETRGQRRLGFLLAIILGLSLSALRIAMGGHFFSDTAASALVMWYTPYTLNRLC